MKSRSACDDMLLVNTDENPSPPAPCPSGQLRQKRVPSTVQLETTSNMEDQTEARTSGQGSAVDRDDAGQDYLHHLHDDRHKRRRHRKKSKLVSPAPA